MYVYLCVYLCTRVPLVNVVKVAYSNVLNYFISINIKFINEYKLKPHLMFISIFIKFLCTRMCAYFVYKNCTYVCFWDKLKLEFELWCKKNKNIIENYHSFEYIHFNNQWIIYLSYKPFHHFQAPISVSIITHKFLDII